jgi:hypothetical protein
MSFRKVFRCHLLSISTACAGNDHFFSWHNTHNCVFSRVTRGTPYFTHSEAVDAKSSITIAVRAFNPSITAFITHSSPQSCLLNLVISHGMLCREMHANIRMRKDLNCTLLHVNGWTNSRRSLETLEPPLKRVPIRPLFFGLGQKQPTTMHLL